MPTFHWKPLEAPIKFINLQLPLWSTQQFAIKKSSKQKFLSQQLAFSLFFGLDHADDA